MTREEAIKWLEYSKQGEIGKAVEAADIAIKALEQEPKTGHWIKIKPYPLQMHEYECSECLHETDDPLENYCSECGAKMVEPQESEVSDADSD